MRFTQHIKEECEEFNNSHRMLAILLCCSLPVILFIIAIIVHYVNNH